MMLVVDIGNSRIKWATVKNGVLEARGAAEYQDQTLEQQLQAAFASQAAPDSVTYCSVGASETGDTLERWTRARWSVSAKRVRTASRGFGVRCAYAHPETMGADRWAALVACRRKHKSAAVIVDCGTAITVDAISHSGEHLGGVIVPGVALMRHALTSRTDQILAEASDSRQVPARTTADAVAAGTLYAAAAAVDRLSAELAAHLPSDSIRLLTGGAMDLLRPIMTTEFERDPDLVLFGLGIIGGAIE